MLRPMTNHATTGAKQPIRLGALAPLSRPGFLEAGRHLLAGIELAVAEINEAGGMVGGRPLELLVRDTAGTPELGAAAVSELAAEGAVAVVGEYHSVVAYAAAGAAVEARLPFVCSSAVLDAVVDSPTDIVARIAPAQSYCWGVYADYLVSAGYGHVALVMQPDRYWSSGARLLRASLTERRVVVTEIEYTASLDTPDTSVTDVLAAADGVDALLLLVGYPEPAVDLVRAVRADARLAGLRIGDPAGRAEFPQWLALLGEDGADVPFLRYLSPGRGTQIAQRLTRIVGQSPSFVAFEGYDSVQVVAEALRIGGPDRRGVSEALSGVRVAGTRGTIDFPRGSGPILQWTWPPVQIAAHRDARRPQEVGVLYQAAAA